MINIVQTLKRCQIEGFTKRVKRTAEVDATIYLLAEARDGRWIFVESAPDGFDAIFCDDEASALARAPGAVRRQWT